MANKFDPAWTTKVGDSFLCTFDGCPKSFKHARSCYDHFRQNHLEAKKFFCQHCKSEFSKDKCLQNHLRGGACKALRLEVWNLDKARQSLLDRSARRTQNTDPMRRNRMTPKKLSKALHDLLEEYDVWEKSPVGDLYRPNKIALLTLQGYKSHLKKWFEFISDLVDQSKEDFNWTQDLASVMRQFCEMIHGQDFFTATFAIKGPEIRSIDTIRNYCWALMRWTKFVESRLNVKDGRFAEVRHERVVEMHGWAQKTAASHAVEARQQKLLRNNLDHLQENNRWIDYHQLLTAHDEMTTFWEVETERALTEGLGLGPMLRFSAPWIYGEISPKFPGVVPCGEGRRPERTPPSPSALKGV